MRILIAEPGYSTKIREPLDENGRYQRHYHVYIHEATLWKYLLQKAYHWYDMRIPIQIPGWKRFIDRYCKLTGAENRTFQPAGWPKARLRDRIVGWEYQQDLRCYELSLHGRKDVKSVCLDLTDEQYLKLRSKTMKRLDEREDERRAERLRDGGDDSLPGQTLPTTGDRGDD